MSDLQTLIFEDDEQSFPVRVVDRDGLPWFIGKDACAPLEYQNYRDAIEALDDDDKGVVSSYTPGGVQDMIVISLRGLATLMVRSRQALTPNSRAWRFRRWILGTVLEQIFRTGKYAVGETVEDDPTEGWPWDVITRKIQLVREVRLTCGQKAAATLAARIGLPGVEPLPGAKAGSAVAQGIDFVRQFVAERVEDAPGGRVQASALFEAFKGWAETNGLPPMTLTAFGRTLTALGLRRSTSQVVYYIGIRLKHLSEVTG